MKEKIIMALMVVAAAAFTCMSAGVYEAQAQPVDAAAHIDKTSADVEHLIGKNVMDQQGQKLGTVKDFLMDPNGRVTVAVVSHGGYFGVESKDVAVPFPELKWDQAKDHFTMNATPAKLAGAPAYTGRENVSEEGDYAKQVYGYFGVPQQPQGQPQATPQAKPQPQSQGKPQATPQQ